MKHVRSSSFSFSSFYFVCFSSGYLGGNSAGGVNEAWRCIGEEMDAAAEAHRLWGIALGEQLAKPLRVMNLHVVQTN